jgi:recombination protein RecT
MANQVQNQLALIKKDTVDVVASKVREFQQKGELVFPPNYSVENAMKAAWLKLQEVTDRNNVPALQCCTKDSIANALLTMAVYGLTPLKDQGYFIVYGKKLVWQNSYFGNVSLWKRVTGADEEPVAVVVYEGDELEYEIVNGEYTITKHKQSLNNINDSKIVAAYAILTMPNGTKKTALMTIDQIKKAWEQGQTKGNSSAHKNFPGEMAKKTVINRACKIAIKSSNDSNLSTIKQIMKANDQDIAEAIVEAEIAENANQEVIDIDPEENIFEGEATEVKEEPIQPQEPELKEQKPTSNKKDKKDKLVEAEQVTMEGDPY